MTIQIEYQPAKLSFDSFHRVDVECFPEEPIAADGLARYLAQDFWAAYEGEALVGFCYAVRKPDVAWISRIGVASSHRRQGVGARLMETAIAHCRQIGLPDVILYVRSDNGPALRLYERFGFRPVESAYQFILADPRQAPADVGEAIRAVPIVDLPRSSWPQLPREWANIAEIHNPPEQYVLVFQDSSARSLGYCRLSPGFPGCFPFVVERPAENLPPVLRALHDYLLPEKDILKLTFSSDELAEACTALGLQLNYRLFQMLRPGSER